MQKKETRVGVTDSENWEIGVAGGRGGGKVLTLPTKELDRCVKNYSGKSIWTSYEMNLRKNVF